MSHVDHSPRAFLLSLLLVLGVFLSVVTAAQAEGELKIVAHEGVPLQGAGTTTQLLNVSAKELIFHCSTSEISWFWKEKPGQFEGEKKLTNCVTLQKGVENKGCKPLEPITFHEIGIMILHSSRVYILSKPIVEAEKPVRFALIQFDEAKCALPITEVTGSFVLECLTTGGEAGSCSEELVTHNVKLATTELFPSDTLKYGANPATYEGTASLALTGVNTGSKWSCVV